MKRGQERRGKYVERGKRRGGHKARENRCNKEMN